jgi:multisubunit Na+/H+ antiporter MnhE subunit
MSKPGDRTSRGVLGNFAKILFVLAVIAVLWIWFVSGMKLHEMVVGFAVMILVALFTVKVVLSEELPIELRAEDVIQLWRLPWYILRDTVVVTWILLRNLGGKRAGSYYRYCGFSSSKHDPVKIARSVLATTYTTASPNTVVIGIDPDQNHILFHQLQRGSVSTMAKNLGAQR